MNLCIIIPAYNEETRIGRTLEIYSSFFESNRIKNNQEYGIIVSINGTTDNTKQIVSRFSNLNKRITYINLKEAGKGLAVVEGFKKALEKKYDVIGFVDADLSTSPQEFLKIALSISGKHGAIASRWIKGSKIIIKQSFMRQFLSRGFNFLVRTILFLPFRDTQCGAKVFKAEALSQIIKEIGITNWAFDIDLLFKLKKKGLKIREVPTIWKDNKNSKLNLKRTPFQMFFGILRIRLINSPLYKLVMIYDNLPIWLKLHNYLSK